MKMKLITLIVIILLSACSKEIPSHRLVFNGEIAFEEGSNKPFTGVANEYKNSYLQSLNHFMNGVLTKEENFYKNGQLKKLVIIDAAGIAKTTLFTESGKDVTNERQKTYWENGVTQSTFRREYDISEVNSIDINIDVDFGSNRIKAWYDIHMQLYRGNQDDIYILWDKYNLTLGQLKKHITQYIEATNDLYQGRAPRKSTNY